MQYRTTRSMGEMRYLRRDGNRRVRARRRRRTVLRMTLIISLWAAGAAGAAAGTVSGVRWVMSPERFRLVTITVKGTQEVIGSEIVDLTSDWMSSNIFNIALSSVERKVREHRWIGSSGEVRIRRRFPDGLVVTVRERVAAGSALVNGVVYLVDEKGTLIDRFGPRYRHYDFPIIKGLERLVSDLPASGTDLRNSLLTGVRVTRALEEREPGLYRQVSEIDMSDRSMITLRLEGESYDLRLSREDYTRNLDLYFTLRNEIKDDDREVIEYVDLRWRDRIAVMPALAHVEQDGGR